MAALAKRARSDGSSAGFTLVEALVAMAILSIVLLGFLGTRSDALVDSAEARNWRMARELAQQILSELQAGAREIPPTSGEIVPVTEDYPPGFSYQVLIGEEHIAAHEAQMVQSLETDAGYQQQDRMAWQHERDQQRMARQKGLSLDDWRRQRLAEETEEEDEVPSETDLEEVAVVVYFPDVRLRDSGSDELNFVLKAKVSTLAVQGLTPEQAQAMANAKGVATNPGNQPPGASGAGGTGAEGGAR